MEARPLVLVASVLSMMPSACGGRVDAEDVIAPEAVLAAERAGVPFPAANAPSVAKSELGRLLFWDPILSADRDVACASCHHPSTGYADRNALAIGTGGRRAARNTMTVLDAAWNGWTGSNPYPDATLAPMFWDNRARSFEQQALGPISGENEMRGPHFSPDTIMPELVRRLTAIPAYAPKFEAAFGSATITEQSVGRALATFERTLVTVPSWERYLAGDAGALDAQQKRGLAAFRSSGCSQCHSGPMLSDFTLHRFSRDGEAMRTASLRNVLRTAPYMHDGRAATFDAVFEIYRNVDRRADDRFENLRVPRGEDRADLVRFLEAASDGKYDDAVPESVPSGLSVGGAPR